MRIVAHSQPGQRVLETLETLSQKNPSQKRAGGAAQGIGPSPGKKKKKGGFLRRNPVFHVCSY
jgi:hypothetical protein